jgi:hypothetical protein
MKGRRASVILIPLLILVPLVRGAEEDKIDEVSTKLIKEYTTKPEYLSPLVDHIPESDTVSSPRDFLGYVAGAPKKLTHARDIHRYFYELAKTSPNIKVFETGKSHEGRSRILAVIADAKTLSALDTHKAHMKKLADPRSLEEKEAHRIIQKAKPMYQITGGLHSPETGSPDMLMELAYRLVVSNTERIKSIRENVITLIIPVLEVDGREKLVDWYYRYTIDVTDMEESPPMSPPYWGKYTLHDNNRDGIQVSQPLTQQVFDVFFEYYPVITHDLHESFPLLYIYAGTGPFNRNYDPISITEFQLFAQYEVAEFTKFGMPGAWTWAFPVGWYPGYPTWVSTNHNSTARFYETYGNAGANTFERKVRARFANKDVTTRQWYRLLPPPKTTSWSFRNNINYQQTGLLCALFLASQNRKLLLENFWTKGKNALHKGKSEPPYAFLISWDNKRKDMLNYLLRQLDKQKIEVHVLNKEITIKEEIYPKGTLVVKLDQPYGPLAKNLLEIQKFPEGSDFLPYDDISWTMGLLYGVKTVQVDDKSILNEPMEKISFPFRVESEIPQKDGAYGIIPNHGSPSVISLRSALKDMEILAAEEAFTIQKRALNPGSLIIDLKEGSQNGGDKVKEAARKFSLDLIVVPEKPDVAAHEIDLPRLGVYHDWVYTQDTGWFRYAIEEYGIDYTLINDDVLRAGNLNTKFDMIIIPDLGRFMNPKLLLHGIDDKWSPLPYTKAEEFPSHGAVDQTDDMTRGMGFEGLMNLDAFVKEGGLLVTLGGGSILPVDLGLAPPVSRVNPAALGVVNPGSFLKTKILQPDSPIAYGYDEVTHVYTGVSPVFTVSFKDRGYIVMQYGETEAKDYPEESEPEKNFCLSGLVKNQKPLIHKPAILKIPREKGQIVIFNWNPVHRYLNHHDFGFVFNTILHWNDL